MKRLRTSAALAFTLGLATLAWRPLPAGAQDPSSVTPREVRSSFRPQDPAIPASLNDVYRRMAAYWEDGNARAIAQLAGGGRVYVVVQRSGIGERLAASQLQYLLQALFDEGQEVTFRFPAYTAYDPNGGTGYAVGERVWQEAGDPEPRVDRVFVGARNDRGRWTLTEIRLTID